MAKPAGRDGRLWKGVLPTHGVITAGPLTGWRYAFIQFIRIENDIAMDMRCTRPNWPFPKTVRFRFSKHQISVRAVSGERAKRLDANALLLRCMQDGIAKSPIDNL
jgi:hypothetical protein